MMETRVRGMKVNVSNKKAVGILVTYSLLTGLKANR